MLEYLKEFFEEFEYEMIDRCALGIAYDKIMACEDAGNILLSLIRGYDKDTRFIKSSHIENIERMASISGVHKNTAIMLTLILLSKKMRERLLKLGLAKKVISSTLLDFKYKLIEGKKLHGVVGFDKFDWYLRFLELRIFAIGRLQFELRQYPGDTITVNGITVKNAEPVLYTHIPRDGTPLDIKLCNASFKEARRVISKLIGVENIPILCASWLLYPKNRDFLPESSNIIKFMDRFELIRVDDSAPGYNGIIPFIFAVREDTRYEDLPEDSSLQKSYKNHLLSGGVLGAGTGVLRD